MKRLHLFILLVLFPFFLHAQEYANKLKPLLIDLSGWNANKPEGMDASYNNPKISNRKSQALFIADRLRISSVLVIHQNRELLDRG